jgi:hypothetical protein
MSQLCTENTGIIHVRAPRSLFERIENWRRSQTSIPSKSEAVRALIERALVGSDGIPKFPNIANVA